MSAAGSILAAVTGPLFAAVSQGHAQGADPEIEAAGDDDVIVVDGASRRGATLSDIEPELVLTEADIAAYGVTTFSELLAIIAAETSSGRGRRQEPPVPLINGRRVAGFRELDNYPVEAIARVEVLPEEVSLEYGFSPNQRVINFILKPNLRIVPLNNRIQSSSDGGSVGQTTNLTNFFVNGERRRSLSGTFTTAPTILETERSITPIDSPEAQRFRALTPELQEWDLGATWSRGFGVGGVATFNGAYDKTESTFRVGQLFSVPGEVALQTRDAENAFLGLSVNSGLSKNTWSFAARVEHDNSQILTDPLLGASPDATEGKRSGTNATADYILNRRLSSSEAGPTTLSATVSVASENQTSVALSGMNRSEIELDRQSASLLASLNRPLDIRRGAYGDIILNANLKVAELSDVGTLISTGAGITWRPVQRVQIIASYNQEEEPRPLDEIAAPRIETPQSEVFDFAQGASVLATVISGDNPDIRSDRRRVAKVSLQVKPWEKREFTLNTDYTTNVIDGEARVFSVLTEAFEQVFPDRVIRDENGALLAFDQRPVRVDTSERNQLRTGINWSKQLKAVRLNPNRRSTRRRSGRPGAIRASVYHRWTLKDEIDLGGGLAPLDLLGGDATSRFGGTPEHAIDATMYRWNNGWGVYASARYRSGTEIQTGADVLEFSDNLNVILSVSYEFNFSDWMLDRFGFLDDTRVTFGVANLLDDVVEVRDANGDVPLAFQPELIDPVGQGWRFELRKRF